MSEKRNLITRRQAIVSLSTLTAGALIKPTSALGFETTTAKTRFAVIGDFGTGDDDQIHVANRMLEYHKQLPLDFVLTVGDNIYPNGSGRYFVKNFENPFAGLLRERVPFYAVLGNHDVEEGRQDQLQYQHFNMLGQRYYKITRGNGLVDFFMLDATDLDVTQMNWFEHALKDSRARWKVVLTHQALYSSGKKHGCDTSLRKKLEPLLTYYRVQVSFAGHDHIYERTKPQNGIQYFVTGAGGKMRRGDVDLKSPFRAASYDQDNHFMLIELDESGMEFQAICETGAIVDKGIIRQDG